jgi:hypothetical protein
MKVGMVRTMGCPVLLDMLISVVLISLSTGMINHRSLYHSSLPINLSTVPLLNTRRSVQGHIHGDTSLRTRQWCIASKWRTVSINWGCGNAGAILLPAEHTTPVITRRWSGCSCDASCYNTCYKALIKNIRGVFVFHLIKNYRRS